MEFELLSCPECGEPLLDDLRDYANDSREYEGQFAMCANGTSAMWSWNVPAADAVCCSMEASLTTAVPRSRILK